MRRYEESHPWITFSATDVNDLDPRAWMLMGEARSKCEHLAGAPLAPAVAERLYRVMLVRGARATTAIEGNTLTEAQVAGILDGTFRAPPSRAYQEREVRNTLDALQGIADQVMAGNSPAITADLIRELNRQVLVGVEHAPEVVPGKVRQHEVRVGTYRGAPAEDCEYLLNRLAKWLESATFKPRPKPAVEVNNGSDDDDEPGAKFDQGSNEAETRFALAMACALYAHLYLAWVHPFGDGNGRTSRLLEFLILARSGLVPVPAIHLLSNHYNLTRSQYYARLSEASRTRRAVNFLTYGVRGFVDGLRGHIEEVRQQQLAVTWINCVHEVMDRLPTSPARDRQRTLALTMPSDRSVSKDELPLLTPRLAGLYATKGPRTLSRDLNRLQGVGLVIKRGQGWVANHRLVRAFLPPLPPVDH